MTYTFDSLCRDGKLERQEILSGSTELLRQLIRIDTTNPPGNETVCAELVADELRADKLEPQLIETAPGRSCVVTRIKGSGKKPPLLLAAHLDVVEADASKWKHPPHAADIDGGYIYGRGAIDMKNMVAMSTTVMKLLARLEVPLDRDVIFAAVADEEAGCDQGSMKLVSDHPELVRAEYMLGEVGGFSLYLMGKTFYPIQVAEKGACWIKARATGEPGHGSMPRPDSSVVRLAEAVAKLGRARLPHHSTRALETFLKGLADKIPLPASKVLPLLANPRVGYRVLDAAIRDPAQKRTFAALMSNTATPTVLRAGDKTNVVPAEASVQIDGRTLPGQTTSAFLAELREIIGHDIELEILRDLPPVETSADTPLFSHLARTIERHDPGSTAVPYMIPGFTDAKAFHKLGTKCYGFSPVRFDPSHGVVFSQLYHGHNERIPVDGYQWGLRVLWDAVSGFCGANAR